MRQRIFFLLMLTMLLVLAWLGIKVVSWVKDPMPTFYGNYLQYSYRSDSLLGYKPAADTTMHSIKMVENDTVYNVQYHIDHFARRLATNKQHDTLANKHILFFGCSFTFGEGLDDSLTIPYLVGEGFANYQVYNFGYPGYGPQQMLASLQATDGLQGVTQKQGVAIYTLLPEHIYRAIGAMYVCTHWGSHMPYYQQSGDTVIRHGDFTSGRPYKAAYYKAMRLLGLSTFIAPPAITQKDIDLTVAIIVTARNTYLRRFPGSRFYVLMYPPNAYWAEGQKLHDLLIARGVEVLDYRKLFPLDSSHYIIGDGHPNGLATHTIAHRLVEDVGR